jgi:phytoene dehydrogenase-like protein
MPSRARLDAIVVGSGPNGLAAAIELARSGRSVRVYEAQPTLGGGLRSFELTLPGFTHDLCASVVPLAVGSPFFESLDLASHGVAWDHPAAPLAHLLAPDRAVTMERDLDAMADRLGRDGRAWRRLFGPLVRDWDRLADHVLGPPIRIPRHPIALARFGLPALVPASILPRLVFREAPARALFTSIAAHSMVDLRAPLTSAFGLVLGLLGHRFGWPVVRGGSGRIATALVAIAEGFGVEFVLEHSVTTLRDLPPARAVVLDLTPRQVLAIAGDQLPSRYRRGLERYRYGPGVFKVDWALDGAVPWRDPAASRAATVHFSGTDRELVVAEGLVARGRYPDRPFILFVQPTVADPTRAPAGKHIAWAYTHVPNGSTVDLTELLEREVERHAPGFRDLIIGRAVHLPADLEALDANQVGGDINGGLQDLRQALFRPVPRWDPYSTPLRGLYLCSSATPPGGGVHGMAGWHAARSSLDRIA